MKGFTTVEASESTDHVTFCEGQRSWVLKPVHHDRGRVRISAPQCGPCSWRASSNQGLRRVPNNKRASCTCTSCSLHRASFSERISTTLPATSELVLNAMHRVSLPANSSRSDRMYHFGHSRHNKQMLHLAIFAHALPDIIF